jgi:hypothetical protein
LASSDKTARLWQAATGALQKTLEGHTIASRAARWKSWKYQSHKCRGIKKKISSLRDEKNKK